MTAYQVIVLSGGGSKGPYGLGALLALEKFHLERVKKVTQVFCGTSVGALNATLAAQNELSTLTSLYSTITTKEIIGKSTAKLGRWRMFRRQHKAPFHYFDNTNLRATITKYANFEKLENSHLLICATNYTTGRLETFYKSSLVDEFIEFELTKEVDSRRLVNFHRIKSQDDLINALMASTAIPFYLPPISIDKSIYVDGGIGNNTPLRQAAHLARFLSCKGDSTLEPTYCIINEPARFKINSDHVNGISGVVRRTMDIYHNEIVSDAHGSWEKINHEVQKTEEKKRLLSSQIDGMDDLDIATRASLKERLVDSYSNGTASTKKCDLRIYVVRPKYQLIEDILEFNPKKSNEIRMTGIADCLELLRHSHLITHNNHLQWSEELD